MLSTSAKTQHRLQAERLGIEPALYLANIESGLKRCTDCGFWFPVLDMAVYGSCRCIPCYKKHQASRNKSGVYHAKSEPLPDKICDCGAVYRPQTKTQKMCESCRIVEEELRALDAQAKSYRGKLGASTCARCSRAMQGDKCYRCGWVPNRENERRVL
jgi:hypothetical protein